MSGRLSKCQVATWIKFKYFKFRFTYIRYDTLNIKLYSDFQQKGNVEKFYTKYFNEVPPKTTNYFPGLSEKTATFLTTKVADHMLFIAKRLDDVNQPTRPRDITSTTNTNLSEREISGGQYLGGMFFTTYTRNRKAAESGNRQKVSKQFPSLKLHMWPTLMTRSWFHV